MNTQKPTLPPPHRQPQPLTLSIIPLPRTCPLCGEVDCEAGDTGACESFADEMERLDKNGGWK